MMDSRVQPVPPPERRQASRTRPPPPALKRLIDIANSIPPECERAWRYFCDFLEPQVQDWQEFSKPKYADDYREDISLLLRVVRSWSEWEEFMDGFPEDFYEDIKSRRYHPLDMLGRARSIVAIRETIRHIAKQGPILKEDFRRIVDKDEYQPAVPIPAIHLDPDAFLMLRVNKEGLIEVTLGEIASAVANAEVDRIRECSVCRRIFWAGRSDQVCCRTKCAKVLRTRRWRDKYLVQYKEQRYQKAEQADPLGRKAKPAKEHRERKQLATLPEPTRPQRRAPRLPSPATKRKR